MNAPIPACLVVPSVNVLGAYFPDWMFCLVGSLLLMIPLRLLLSQASWCRALGRPGRLVLYPTLWSLVALLGWIAFFMN